MTGFYCYQTNLANYPQNDALMYGAGFTAGIKDFRFKGQLTGYSGYLNNGDHPMLARFILEKSFNEKLSLRFKWQLGLRDFDYQTLKLSFTWKFTQLKHYSGTGNGSTSDGDLP